MLDLINDIPNQAARRPLRSVVAGDLRAQGAKRVAQKAEGKRDRIDRQRPGRGEAGERAHPEA
jgi:hypothetical protein